MAFINQYIIKGDITEVSLNHKDGTKDICIIDTEDLQKLIEYNKTWYIHVNQSNDMTYVYANIYLGKIDGEHKYTTISLNMFLMGGKTGDRIIVDHYNHNPLDNRKENLRISSVTNNATNRSSKNKNNKSGYRNVCWDKKSNKWMVQIQIKGKNKVLKRFKKNEVEEAGKYAEQMRQKYYGEFAGNS